MFQARGTLVGTVCLTMVATPLLVLAQDGPPLQPATTGQQPAEADAPTPPPRPADPTPAPVDNLTPEVLDSGVKIYTLKAGDGEQPRPGAKVTVHYHGWLAADTKLFDSSFKKNRPFTTELRAGKLINGWIQAIPRMQPGGRYRLDIPADQGYGARGYARLIPPDADLIFEVELVSIDKQGPEQIDVSGIDPVATSSGLKYWEINEGSGAMPTVVDKVVTQFDFWLEDGTYIGGSGAVAAKMPELFVDTFPAGLQEALRTMQPGSQRRLWVPSDSAFGERGSPGVPPGTAVVVELKLLEVLKPLPQRAFDEAAATVMSNGLKVWDLQEGTGNEVTGDSRCRVRYAGWLTSGKMFDTNRLDGDDLFTCNMSGGVIEGWLKGLPGMKNGGVRRLEIPPALAYGDRASKNIPANATLLFEVEVVELVEPIRQSSIEGIEPVELEDGLRYWDLKLGDGEEATPPARCKVHYTGWLTDGTQFDSSVEKGVPYTFSLTGGVIPGWIKGVPGMRIGGKRRLEIPPDLAYGSRGQGRIPANATLVFEIELLEIPE